MRHIRLLAIALLTAGSLVACSAGQSSDVIQPMVSMRSSSKAEPARGGTFAAGYAGESTLEPCVSGYRGKVGTFTFSGSGSASFLHSSLEQGKMTMNRLNNGKCIPKWVGNATLVSVRHPSNTVALTLQSQESFKTPCQEAVTFSVTGGTGKFRNAEGSGMVRFQCSGYGNIQYADAWSGTITF